MSVELKNNAVEKCLSILSEKIKLAQKSIEDASASNNSEQKSSAGDKHNTSQAMLHLEQEKNAKNYAQLMKQYRFLKSIDFEKHNDQVRVGALVICEKQTFLIGVSLGKILVEEHFIFCISAAAPLGQKLLGLQSGETVDFRGQMFKISGIY